MAVTKKPKQASLFDIAIDPTRSQETRDTAKGLLMYGLADTGIADWRGVIALPPGTLVERIVSSFQQGSDIPLEIPFFVFLSWTAGYLLNRGVTAVLPEGDIVKPDLWTVLLSDSGSGKTFSEKRLRSAIGDDLEDIEFQGTGIASAARFVEELKTSNNRVWVRDEFAQFLKQINTSGGNLEEVKDLLLRIHDGATITRKTKDYETIITDPALVILGLTVGETFERNISTEDMIDGFAQRFSIIRAKKDPKRPMLKFPRYRVSTEGWNEAWRDLTAGVTHKSYHATQKAMDAYDEAFRSFVGTERLPESFFRRLMWRAHKYALVYHVLTGRAADPELSPNDYGWAARVTSMHLDDAIALLNGHGQSDLAKNLMKVEEMLRDAAKTGREIKPRDIVRGIYSVKSTAEAKALLEFARS